MLALCVHGSLNGRRGRGFKKEGPEETCGQGVSLLRWPWKWEWLKVYYVSNFRTKYDDEPGFSGTIFSDKPIWMNGVICIPKRNQPVWCTVTTQIQMHHMSNWIIAAQLLPISFGDFPASHVWGHLKVPLYIGMDQPETADCHFKTPLWVVEKTFVSEETTHDHQGLSSSCTLVCVCLCLLVGEEGTRTPHDSS